MKTSVRQDEDEEQPRLSGAWCHVLLLAGTGEKSICARQRGYDATHEVLLWTPWPSPTPSTSASTKRGNATRTNDDGSFRAQPKTALKLRASRGSEAIAHSHTSSNRVSTEPPPTFCYEALPSVLDVAIGSWRSLDRSSRNKRNPRTHNRRNIYNQISGMPAFDSPGSVGGDTSGFIISPQQIDKKYHALGYRASIISG